MENLLFKLTEYQYEILMAILERPGQNDMLPSYRTMKYKSPIWGDFHV